MFEEKRKRISRYYFELAERCPDWLANRVKAIKYLRGNPYLEEDPESLSESELLYALSLQELYFLEVYRPRDFHRLEDGTEKLFGRSAVYNATIDQYNKFFEELYSPNLGGWKLLGSILPPGSDYPANARAFSELPDVVERVDLSLHKILPSLAVVVSRITLSEDINYDIKKILTEEYKTEVELSSLIPWRAYKGYRHFRPDKQRNDKFDSLFNDVQAGVEDTLTDNFAPGYFISSAEGIIGSPKCPSFRVYLASPYNPVAEVISNADYRKDNRELLDGLSFGAIDPRFSDVYVGQNNFF